MGRLFEREYAALSRLREDPARPFVFVLGGTKVDDAFLMMRSVLDEGIVDEVLTGGLVGQIMLIAAGVDPGAPSTAVIRERKLWDWVAESERVLSRHGGKVRLPLDVACVQDGTRHEVDIEGLPVDGEILDIGHATVDAYVGAIRSAGTAFVNGPLGVFEEPATEYGTRSVWEAMASMDGHSAIGGGDSIAAMNKYGLSDRFDYVCTAGGGMVRFLSGEVLPVVAALKEAAARTPRGSSSLS
jgi:phosphoglycerate kinase